MKPTLDLIITDVEQISTFLYIPEDRHAEQTQAMLRQELFGASLVSIHPAFGTFVSAGEILAAPVNTSAVGTPLSSQTYDTTMIDTAEW